MSCFKTISPYFSDDHISYQYSLSKQRHQYCLQREIRLFTRLGCLDLRITEWVYSTVLAQGLCLKQISWSFPFNNALIHVMDWSCIPTQTGFWNESDREVSFGPAFGPQHRTSPALKPPEMCENQLRHRLSHSINQLLLLSATCSCGHSFQQDFDFVDTHKTQNHILKRFRHLKCH